MKDEIKLTKLAKCAGCGAKVGAGILAQLLGDIRVRQDENLLVGFDKSDDASVYKVSDGLALVQTVDFFPPIADDPYTFGQIAATNALSDFKLAFRQYVKNKFDDNAKESDLKRILTLIEDDEEDIQV